MVLIDPAVLSTLPEREFRAGLYEALKCGVIGKPELFRALENVDIKKLRRDPAKLEWIIAESVKLKAEVVSSDERENGLRRVLNLGHTIGHALEAQTGYRHFLHGEAVAWGMIASAKIASAVDRIEATGASRITDATACPGPAAQGSVAKPRYPSPAQIGQEDPQRRRALRAASRNRQSGNRKQRARTSRDRSGRRVTPPVAIARTAKSRNPR